MGCSAKRSSLSSEHRQESVWIDKVRVGDSNAFEEMFRAYYAKLVRFAIHYVKSQQVAEEIVQEVFVNIWGQRAEWTVRQTPRAYFYGAVRNRSLSYLKKHRTEEPLQEEEIDKRAHPQESLDDDLHARDFHSAAEKAVEALPERCRLIFTLHREGGLTYQEIASMLGISVNTVETQMVRALRTLRRLLSDYLPFVSALCIFSEALS